MSISYEGATSLLEKQEACRLEIQKLRQEAVTAGEAAKAAKTAENKTKIDELEIELNQLEADKKTELKAIIN